MLAQSGNAEICIGVFGKWQKGSMAPTLMRKSQWEPSIF